MAATLRACAAIAVVLTASAHTHRDAPSAAYRAALRETETPAMPMRSAAAPARWKNQTTIWVEGMFDNSYPVPEMLADAAELGASGFSTAILAFGHVHAGGDIVYNNIPVSEATTLPAALAVMRNGSISKVCNAMREEMGD